MKKFLISEFAKSRSLVSSGDKYLAGQVVIIGGSSLFHGAPILSLKAASRLVSMTYFSSPSEDKGIAEKIKSSLSSFVWVEREQVDSYIAKSDAILIGPGLMRSHIKEQKFVCDSEGEVTRNLSLNLFKKFPDKKWVVDGGTLQVVSVKDIPRGSVVTPNKKEFEMLFGEKLRDDFDERCEQVFDLSKKHGLVILTKDAVAIASNGVELWTVEGGSDGLVKGGVGDVIAGLTLGFLAKDDPLFAACAATFLVKKAAEELTKTNSFMFNSDDLVDMVPTTYGRVVTTTGL